MLRSTGRFDFAWQHCPVCPGSKRILLLGLLLLLILLLLLLTVHGDAKYGCIQPLGVPPRPLKTDVFYLLIPFGERSPSLQRNINGCDIVIKKRSHCRDLGAPPPRAEFWERGRGPPRCRWSAGRSAAPWDTKSPVGSDIRSVWGSAPLGN